MPTTTQTETIASLYAQFEATVAEIAALEATGERYDAKDNPMEIAEGSWTKKGLKLI